MNVLQTLPVASRALLRNKTRSFLTTLGVVIGVASVISMVAIGEGAKSQVEDAFNAMGTNLLIVMSGSTSSGGVFGGMGSMPTLSWDDLDAIKREAPAVRAVAPLLTTKLSLIADDANWNTQVGGTTPDYFDIRNWPVERGTMFTDSDIEGNSKTLVIGHTVADHLFGAGIDPVGRTIRMQSIPFLVQGVLVKKGQSPVGQDYDDAVYIPYTTYQTKIKGGLQKYIAGVLFVGAKSSDDTPRAQTEIQALLRDRHHLDNGVDDDFQIRNLTEIANAQQEGTNTFTSLLAAIAAVSLLVGGIGIMNIMLVSVSARSDSMACSRSWSRSARARSACAWPSVRSPGTSLRSFWWKPSPCPSRAGSPASRSGWSPRGHSPTSSDGRSWCDRTSSSSRCSSAVSSASRSVSTRREKRRVWIPSMR